ncbi:hypothetical protein ACFL16_00120 [Patescibacteria group bacterium]
MRMRDYDKTQSEFNEWIDNVHTKNDEYFEVITEIMPVFLDFVKYCKHKNTILALSAFHTHLSNLKNAIIDTSETNNLYSTKALYRVYLEHWLKGVYILERYTREKNDNVGIEYNNLGKIGEELQYGNSLKAVGAMIDMEAKKLDVWDTLCEFSPELKKIDKKEIKSNIVKFQYRNIVKYLSDNNSPVKDWALIIIPEYSELSSYVHGGASATSEYANSYDKQFKEYKGMIRFSINTSRLFSYSLFLLMLRNASDKEKKILPLLQKLKDKKDIL